MTVRGIFQWCADSFRFLGAIFYWNTRKSLYRARRCRGKCPCQNESDDPKPGRVRCDAVAHWHDPARFRTVCPLLVSTSHGWCCSVRAAQVRPFWGRVVGWCGAAALILYLTGASVIFAGLRVLTGVPVNYRQIAWPGSWHEVRVVQARFLFQRAIEAFAHGRLSEAHLALLSAQQRDPQNYDAALMLAQIAMFQGSFLASDQQFDRILRDHPAQVGRTAIVYHDTLLSLDRMKPLAPFSLAMAKADPAHSAAWVRSALLAMRSLSVADAADLREKAAPSISALAPPAQLLLQAEFEVRGGDAASALRRLRGSLRGPLHPFYARQQVLRLAELGDPGTAQVLLDFYGPPFGEFEQQLTQFELSVVAHDADAAEAAYRRLLALPMQELRIERIAAALIAHPNPERYHQLSARLRRDGSLAAVCDGAGLWVTGLVCGAPGEAAYWQLHGKQTAMSGYPAIKSVDFRSRDLAVENSAIHLINVMSLPREVILALLARVEPPAPTAKSAATPAL